jgi:predicted DNA-binding mobile mystery protein A
MPKKANNPNLRRRQLDRLFSLPQVLKAVPEFKNGFIREIREALGMTAHQLSLRLDISQPALTQLEQREREGTATLNALRKAAEALDCKFVYALVPNESLQTTLEKRAREAATQLVSRVDRTMHLEDQATSSEEIQRSINEIADRIVRDSDKSIWDEPL